MAFNAAFIAHAPDADPARHHSMIDTGKYKLLLCPGFTNKDVAELDEAVGEGCGIGVARIDPPGGRIAAEVMRAEGWF
jgi:hypothetical protein